MSKSILCVCAHPDDEVLGCGGTIARHVAEGDEVRVIWLADGVRARCRAHIGITQDEIEKRLQAADKATNILGITSKFAGPFYDNEMDFCVSLLQVIRHIESCLREWPAPNIIYTHHLGDLNIDHRITAQAVLTAFRPLPDSSVEAIYSFEVPSSTEWGIEPFVPDHFVHLTDQYMAKKFDALDAYKMEMRDFPHPRSVDGVQVLAQWRGATVGLQYAEAFKTLRSIVR